LNLGTRDPRVLAREIDISLEINRVTENTLFALSYVTMSITKYGDYARPARGTFLDIFIEYVQSDRILCRISTEKMKFTRNPATAAAVAAAHDLCVCIQGYGIEYRKFEEVLAFHNPHFILTVRFQCARDIVIRRVQLIILLERIVFTKRFPIQMRNQEIISCDEYRETRERSFRNRFNYANCEFLNEFDRYYRES